MIKELKKYFKETPKEKVLKDWEATREFDGNPQKTPAIREIEKWRAEFHREYYMINEFNEVVFSIDVMSTLDNWRYNSGNYYQTQQEAQNVWILRNAAPELLRALEKIAAISYPSMVTDYPKTIATEAIKLTKMTTK